MASLLASVGIPILMSLLGGGSVKIHHDHIGHGHKIHVTSTVHKRVMKAKNAGKPVKLKLSKVMIRKNIRGDGILSDMYHKLKTSALMGHTLAKKHFNKIARHVGHQAIGKVQTGAHKIIDDLAGKLISKVGTEQLGTGFWGNLFDTAKSSIGSIAQAVAPTVGNLASAAINKRLNSKFGGSGINKTRVKKVKGRGIFGDILKQVAPVLINKVLGGSVRKRKTQNEGGGLYVL